MKTHTKLFSFLSRTGIALAFLYAGVASLVTPDNWVGFIPEFVRSRHTDAGLATILMLWSSLEIILALWILSGKKLFIAAIVSAVALLLIIVSNLNQIDIVFRDIPILFSALALAVVAHSEKNW